MALHSGEARSAEIANGQGPQSVGSRVQPNGSRNRSQVDHKHCASLPNEGPSHMKGEWIIRETAKLRTMRKNGISISECGVILGRSEQAVKAKISRDGIEGRCSRFWTAEEDQLLRAAVAQGMTWSQLADLFPKRTPAGLKDRAARTGIRAFSGDPTVPCGRQKDQDEWKRICIRSNKRFLDALFAYFRNNHPESEAARRAA